MMVVLSIYWITSFESRVVGIDFFFFLKNPCTKENSMWLEIVNHEPWFSILHICWLWNHEHGDSCDLVYLNAVLCFSISAIFGFSISIFFWDLSFLNRTFWLKSHYICDSESIFQLPFILWGLWVNFFPGSKFLLV